MYGLPRPPVCGAAPCIHRILVESCCDAEGVRSSMGKRSTMAGRPNMYKCSSRCDGIAWRLRLRPEHADVVCSHLTMSLAAVYLAGALLLDLGCLLPMYLGHPSYAFFTNPPLTHRLAVLWWRVTCLRERSIQDRLTPVRYTKTPIWQAVVADSSL